MVITFITGTIYHAKEGDGNMVGWTGLKQSFIPNFHLNGK